MAGKVQDEGHLIRYLLGELSERERERLEVEYFEDDDAFEQMLIAEDDLLDAYARGELSAEERQRFETLFLTSPRVRERVQFALVLAGAVSNALPPVATPESAPRSRFFDALSVRGATLRFALVAAVLTVTVGLAWLLVERARMRAELRELRAERAALGEKAQEMERRVAAEQARSAEMLAQLGAAQARPTPEAGRQGDEADAQQRPPQVNRLPRRRVKKDDAVIARRSPSEMREGVGSSENSAFKPQEVSQTESLWLARSVSYDLTPGLSRGGGANTLAVPGKAKVIVLRLYLEADTSHESYRAVIEDANGRPVWGDDSVNLRRSDGARVAIVLPEIPARYLPPGDYVLRLSGRRPDGDLEGVANYSFRVMRK